MRNGTQESKEHTVSSLFQKGAITYLCVLERLNVLISLWIRFWIVMMVASSHDARQQYRINNAGTCASLLVSERGRREEQQRRRRRCVIVASRGFMIARGARLSLCPEPVRAPRRVIRVIHAALFPSAITSLLFVHVLSRSTSSCHHGLHNCVFCIIQQPE